MAAGTWSAWPLTMALYTLLGVVTTMVNKFAVAVAIVIAFCSGRLATLMRPGNPDAAAAGLAAAASVGAFVVANVLAAGAPKPPKSPAMAATSVAMIVAGSCRNVWIAATSLAIPA